MGSRAEANLDAIWVVEIYKEANDVIPQTQTGTGIKNFNILTCFHGCIGGFSQIEARKVGTDRYYVMEIVKQRAKWDLLLLKFKDERPSNFKYLLISKNEVFAVGADIFVICHDNGNEGKITEGKVISPCVYVDPLTFSDECEFNPNPDIEHPGTRSYQIMQDVMNVWLRYGDYHPKLPLIFYDDWGLYRGRSGGPLFRIDGEIAGVCVGGGTASYNFAVHLSAIKEFLKGDSGETSTSRR